MEYVHYLKWEPFLAHRITQMATDVLSPVSVPVVSFPTLERRAVTIKNRVQCKQDQVVSWLQEFYNAPGNLEKLLPILQGTSPVSLRLVDYFVTNYAKKMNTSFPTSGKHFLVYFNYKRELNAYSKKLFDPFCRRERILFQARGMEQFVTTVGQLNFFRWFLEKNILEFVLANKETIEKDMNSTLKEHYSRSNTTASSRGTTGASAASASAEDDGADGSIATTETLSVVDSTTSGGSSKTPRKKRCELTTSAMKKANVHECDVMVSFC
jgi:hypothetical protein